MKACDLFAILVIQDVVQGHLCDNSQATFVIYYTSEDQSKCLNVCIVSDCHTHVTVHAFILAMVSHLETTLPSIQ